MPFSAGLAWEVRRTASDSNGGGFRGGSALATPPAPSVSGSGTGGTVAANTYYVVITLTDGNGETPKSAETSVTTAGTTSSIAVTGPTNPNVLGSYWNVYVGTTSGGPYSLQNTAAGLAFGSNRSITATPPTTGTQAPGVDYSQQDSPQVTYTDLAIGATNTTATSAANPFTPAHVGNVLNVTSGTGFTVQRAEVVGVSAAGVATVDKALGTASSTGGNGTLGGALLSPAVAAAAWNTYNLLFIRYSATPYDCSSTASAASGRISTSVTGNIVGYDATRTLDNADANRPTLRATSDSMTIVTAGGGSGTNVHNLILAGNGHTSVTGLNQNTGFARNVKSSAVATGFSLNAAGAYLDRCQSDGHTTNGIVVNSASPLYVCTVTNGTGVAISLAQIGASAWHCVVYNNAGSAGHGISVSQPGCLVFGCVIYSVANGHGLNLTQRCLVAGTVAWGAAGASGGTGFNSTLTDQREVFLRNCAGGNNTINVGASAGTLHSAAVPGFLTLTTDPFTAAGSLDFSPNGVAGGGALLRAAGYPSSFPGLATTSYPDVGASQHRSPGRAR